MLRRKLRGKKGFTLIELLIVIIIVGILAAVSVPMMSANVAKAKASEAAAALGSIRTQMRVIKATVGSYPNITTPLDLDGFNAGDLDGRYFVDGDYSIVSTDGDTYTAKAIGTAAAGDKASAVNIVVQINENGVLLWSSDGTDPPTEAF